MYGNNLYQRPYNNLNQQNMYEQQIDNEINSLQQMKERLKNNAMQQPTAINQTFQLAPTHSNNMKYASTIDDVSKETVFNDTPFFSKDMSIVWIKNAKNEIKTYELSEIIPKDEKDIQIEYLQAQIEELKKGMKKDESNIDVDESITDTNESKKSSTISAISKPKAKSK